MKKLEVKYETLNMAVKCGLYTQPKEANAIMKLNDGSRMTSTLYIFNDPTGKVLLNISKCTTLEFESQDELNNYLAKKFEIFKSDKDMWQSFTGMDDETWDEWNK